MSACYKCGRELGIRGDYSLIIKNGARAHRICPHRRLRRGERKRRKIVRHSFGKPDHTSTALRHYLVRTMTDPRSYVTIDGREILYGEDWKRRVAECFERDSSRCQWADYWCPIEATDADHIIKRSKQRDDRLANLRSLCRFHHNLRHKEHRTRFHEGAMPNG